MTIFDFITSTEMVAYWETMTSDRAPYLGETLFPSQKKLGLDLKWIKGSSGLPVVLKPSAFDVGAVPRARLTLSQLAADMPYFKESLYISEEQRQQLLIVMETGNQAYVDTVLNRIFNDNQALLEGAAARREQMRMMALTTGAISIVANGQNMDFDYGIPSTQKVTVTTSWSEVTTDIGADIEAGQTLVETATGIRPTRAVCDRQVWSNMLKNQTLSQVWASTNGITVGQKLNDSSLKAYLMDMYNLEVVVNSKKFKGDTGLSIPYIPTNTFVLFPSGDLGSTWFGTTPEESDLMSNAAVNVTITDVGVAVCTMNKVDPVNVETKVTMITLPSFEVADQVYILDTKA